MWQEVPDSRVLTHEAFLSISWNCFSGWRWKKLVWSSGKLGNWATSAKNFRKPELSSLFNTHHEISYKKRESNMTHGSFLISNLINMSNHLIIIWTVIMQHHSLKWILHPLWRKGGSLWRFWDQNSLFLLIVTLFSLISGSSVCVCV